MAYQAFLERGALVPAPILLLRLGVGAKQPRMGRLAFKVSDGLYTCNGLGPDEEEPKHVCRHDCCSLSQGRRSFATVRTRTNGPSAMGLALPHLVRPDIFFSFICLGKQILGVFFALFSKGGSLGLSYQAYRPVWISQPSAGDATQLIQNVTAAKPPVPVTLPTTTSVVIAPSKQSTSTRVF